MSKATPENGAKTKVKKAIVDSNLPHKMVWNAGTAYCDTVDGTGVIAGKAVAIEVKRFDGKGKGITARQRLFLREWEQAGGEQFFIDSELSLQNFVHWLQMQRPMQ